MNCFSKRHLAKCLWSSTSYAGTGRRIYNRFFSKLIVYQTECLNPHHNLAFEEWMYENVDLSSTACMFLWQSVPSVVIGRHQNAWTECDVRRLREHGVTLARRQSGGGAVYHDMGNMNITFFMSRKAYDRRKNLDMIINALRRSWKTLNVSVNCRDDIILDDNYKISGSSSKLGRLNAYHHCTLLFNANLDNVQSFLQPSLVDVTTKATSSVRSVTKNLVSVDPSITYDGIVEAVKSEFFTTYSHTADTSSVKSSVSPSKLSVSIVPTNSDVFFGIDDMISKLKSWEWIYGKSPKFVTHCENENGQWKLKVSLHVSNGCIDEMDWESSVEIDAILTEIKKNLCGLRFDAEAVQGAWSVGNDSFNMDMLEFVLSTVKRMIP